MRLAIGVGDFGWFSMNILSLRLNLVKNCFLLLWAGYSRSGRQEPDTIVLRGLPSRWFAEPRVSSKPSMLVTHTIFSTFGRIRHVIVFACCFSNHFKTA